MRYAKSNPTIIRNFQRKSFASVPKDVFFVIASDVKLVTCSDGMFETVLNAVVREIIVILGALLPGRVASKDIVWLLGYQIT
jgi:hypothetical protein